MKIPRFIYIFWLLFLLVMLYLYLFEPATFYHMFQYKGPGSPFVNTPMGAVT